MQDIRESSKPLLPKLTTTAVDGTGQQVCPDVNSTYRCICDLAELGEVGMQLLICQVSLRARVIGV
jgi:hypothetical protein